MTFASGTQFHVFLPWGQRLFSIVSYKCLLCESASRHFQPREGPSRGLLRDCTTSPINRFAALVTSLLVVADGLLHVGAAGVRDHAGHGVQRPHLGPHHRRLAAPGHLGVQVLAEGVGAAPRHHLATQ